LYKIPASTLFLGKNLVFVPECHSTNSLALELCQQSCPPEGTLVITRQQTAGRGQRGNTWESAPGMNLTFSLILKPTFLGVKDQFLLSIITSLAICDHLTESYRIGAHIKWPNDILINEFKICGILIENQLMGDRFTNVVVGIGLNVNQREFDAPQATSLAIIDGKTHDLQMVLEGLLHACEVRYFQLREGKTRQLQADYLSSLYQLHKISTFRSGEEQFTGEISGVDEHGKLCVRVEGVERTFGVKEISFVKPAKISAHE
jgi:BirA family transcriptional regulator, biotin operon repressor / biotin---[acetyl-CoA-carboxylase] ligase